MDDLEEINKKALSEISQLNASNNVINKKLAEHQEKYEKDMKKIEEEHQKFSKLEILTRILKILLVHLTLFGNLNDITLLKHLFWLETVKLLH